MAGSREVSRGPKTSKDGDLIVLRALGEGKQAKGKEKAQTFSASPCKEGTLAFYCLSL